MDAPRATAEETRNQDPIDEGVNIPYDDASPGGIAYP